MHAGLVYLDLHSADAFKPEMILSQKRIAGIVVWLYTHARCDNAFRTDVLVFVFVFSPENRGGLQDAGSQDHLALSTVCRSGSQFVTLSSLVIEPPMTDAVIWF